MVLVRGVVTSILFAVGWIALVMSSRPHVGGVAANDAAVHQGVVLLATWSFTPALLTSDERATYESERAPDRASLALANVDSEIATRLTESALLTVLGIAMFWFGILVFTRTKKVAEKNVRNAWARGIVAGGSFVVVGPLLPCLVARGPAGLLISGPPVVSGLVIALLTLILRRFQPQNP